MIRNYILTAFGAMLRQRVSAIINILGLALGLAVCFLIFMFVKVELSFDGWIPDSERIFRAEVTFSNPSQPLLELAKAPGLARAALLKDYPDLIEAVTRIYREPTIVRRAGQQFEEMIAVADANLFDVLQLDFAAGRRDGALGDLSSLVISETMARKYFGDGDPIGQTMTLANQFDYRVVGVLRDLPANTHLTLDFVTLFDATRYSRQNWVNETWFSGSRYTYIKLHDASAIEVLRADQRDFVRRNVAMTIAGLESIAAEDFMNFEYLALADVHLFSNKLGDMTPPGNITTVLSFATVASLILAIAIINFVNIATARASLRAREVGLRKVVGARRHQLILQFMGEAALITVIAAMIALGLAEAALPWFVRLMDIPGTGMLAFDGGSIMGLAALLAAVSILSGLYPALYLSSFRPAQVISGDRALSQGSGWFRQILVIAQFAIAIALFAVTAIVYQQTRFALAKDLGFEKDHKLVITDINQSEVTPQREALRAEIERVPGVKGAAFSWDVPGEGPDSNISAYAPETGVLEPSFIRRTFVGYDFLRVYGIGLVAGRGFSPDFTGDLPALSEAEDVYYQRGVVINETAARRLGFTRPEDAVNSSAVNPLDDGRRAILNIVGVVEDFHITSMHEQVKPFIYALTDDNHNYLTLDIESDDLAATIADIEAIWSRLIPDRPLRHFFIDELFESFYVNEIKQGRLFAGFALFAIVVSALGLFGLASFAAERRTREIGVRKVMGARVFDIVRLLVWQFTKPVLIANLIAWPAAWLFLDRWLDGFAYRIDLSLPPFAAASALAIFVAWATVGGHAFRTARKSPVHSIRHE